MKSTTPSARNWVSLARALRWGLLALCLAYLIRFFIQNRQTLRIVFTMAPTTMAAIIGLHLLYYALQALRFRIVITKCSGTRLPFWPWLRLFILGQFLNLLLSQAGNVYRSVQLKHRYRVTYTRYIGAFASMVWLDLCMNLATALALILCIDPTFRIATLPAWPLVAAVTLVVLAAPILAERLLRPRIFQNTRLDWIHTRLSEVLRVTVANLHDPVYLLKIFALGLLVFARTVWLFDLYFRAFGLIVPLTALALFYVLFKLSFFLLITPGNLGVQEIAWGLLGDQMGVGMAQGVLVSAFGRAVNLAVIGTVGLACGGWDALRHAARTPIPPTSNADDSDPDPTPQPPPQSNQPPSPESPPQAPDDPARPSC